jgi:membrane AbrB-like protein
VTETTEHPIPREAARWGALAAAVVGLGWAMGRLSVPSSYLFAALLIGLALALAAPNPPRAPRSLFTFGQVVVGVVLGTYFQSSTLTSLGTRWIPVVLISVATLALTTFAGLAVARHSATDAVTASLGTVAGGASGIVAMADDLGGDVRLVAFMQFLRVLVITLLTPVMVRLAFHGHGGGAPDSDGILGGADGWLLVAVAGPLGILVGRVLRLPAATLLGPLVLVAAATVLGIAGNAVPPPLVREAGFAAIGLAIGLRFTMEEVRRAGRLLPIVLGSILTLMAACVAMGWLLSVLADVSMLDAYLATTPGGLVAVLPVAFGSGADTTFVLAVQTLRLLVAIFSAPLLARWVLARPARLARATEG